MYAGVAGALVVGAILGIFVQSRYDVIPKKI
jgi:hypothetical protein